MTPDADPKHYVNFSTTRYTHASRVGYVQYVLDGTPDFLWKLLVALAAFRERVRKARAGAATS